MRMKNIFKQMQNLGLFASGIVAHHYGSKLLDLKDNLDESKIQAERDAKLDEIATNIKLLKDNCSSISKKDSFNNNTEVSDDNISSLQEQLKVAEYKSKSVLDSLNKFDSNSDLSSNKENLHKEVSDMLSVTEKIKKLLDGFSDSKGSGKGNNFMPSLNSSLAKLAKTFNVSTLKGNFSHDFANENTLFYIGYLLKFKIIRVLI